MGKVTEGERQELLPRDRAAHVRKKRSIRSDIWTVLHYRSSVQHDTCLQRISYGFEVSILTLILLNVLLAITLTSPSTDSNLQFAGWYNIFLYTSAGIFSVEYALRFWSCIEDNRYRSPIAGRLRWMMQPLSLIDLMALVPFYLEICFEYTVMPSTSGALTFRSLRLLRILSFLRLERSYNAMKSLRVVFTRKKEELLVVTYLTALMVLMASTMIFFLENTAQPGVFSSVSVCAWWVVETITSLGYGDMVPVTPVGRFFGSMLALWGIILFTIPGAVLGSGFIEVMLENQRKQEEAFENTLRETLLSRDFNSGRSGELLFPVASDLPECDIPSFSPIHSSPASIIRIELLNAKVEHLARTQTLLQQQLTTQRAQLDTIITLLKQGNGSTTYSSGNVDTSELVTRSLLTQPRAPPSAPQYSPIIRSVPYKYTVANMEDSAVIKSSLLEIDAIRSFLRNFDEKQWREVLAIVTCYGISCLSRNFDVRDVTVEELRVITSFNQCKKQQFSFRRCAKANPNRPTIEPSILSQCRLKPPHSWRDGDPAPAYGITAETLPPTQPSHVSEAKEKEDGEPQRRPSDELDVVKRLVGKTFAEMAWDVFAQTDSADPSSSVEDVYLRLDERKSSEMFPSALVSRSDAFVDFLKGYILSCVANYRRRRDRCLNHHDGSHVSATKTQTNPVSRPTSARSRQDARRKPAVAANEVSSRIKPALQARKERVLRVRKNQAQIVKESLARARLAEVNKEQQPTRLPREKRMPLDTISTGAAALEIVDNFVNSALMERFSGKEAKIERNNAPSAQEQGQSDVLKEELYGPQPISFECKVPQSKSKRDYRGWLGDYGALHTRSVRKDVQTDEDDEPDTETHRVAFEWSFGEFSEDDQAVPTSVSSFATSSSPSESADPVFRWLKTTV